MKQAWEKLEHGERMHLRPWSGGALAEAALESGGYFGWPISAASSKTPWTSARAACGP